MRVLIDLQGAQNGSRFRGIGRYVLALLTQLIATKADGDEIVLLLNGHFVEAERDIRAAYSKLLGPEAFRVWYPLVPSSWDSQRNAARRMASQSMREWAIREIKPDCVLISSLFEGCGDNVVTSIPDAEMPPVAVVFYDLIPYLFPDQYLGNTALQGWYGDKLQHLRRADLLLAISQASAREAVAHLGRSEHSVVSISSGIDAESFRQPGASWSETAIKFGVSGNYLLYAGAADPRKNLDAFLHAFGTLPLADICELSIVFVGQITDGQKKNFRGIAKKFPRGSKQVIFTGHITDDELISFYRNALAFVFPSMHEGFGLPLLEAMAVGCPVIASNCSAFPEVVGIPEALFDPASIESMAGLIGQVIRDQAFRDWLISAQGKRVTMFSWASVAERAWAAMNDLLARTQVLAGGESRSKGGGREGLIDCIAVQLKVAGASHGDFVLAAEAIERTLADMGRY